MNVKRLTTLALLTAISLIIFIVELQIPNPFPIPGIKLGLANIITVYAVYHYRPAEVASMVAVRLILGAVFSGNFTALIYSASGAFLCLIAVLPLRRIIDEDHLWMLSVIGALMHNTGQIIAAIIVMNTVQLIAYYPFLLVSGCLAGAFTGLAAQLINRRLKKNSHE